MSVGAVPVDLLIRDARWIVSQAGADIVNGWVACTGGSVVGIGTTGDEPQAIRTLDASGCLVTPGLVNAHHHLFQNLTRAYAPSSGLGLDGWLSTLRPLWGRLDEHSAYTSAWIGLAELALAGCTTTADNLYLHPRPGLIEATLTAAGEVGLRLDVCRGYVEGEAGDVPGSECADAVLAAADELIGHHHDPSAASRTRISVGPTALGATSAGLLAEVSQLAKERGVRLHTHLFEQATETTEALRRHGRLPVDVLVAAGWAERSWVAHCIYPSEEDVQALGVAGIGVAHCPSSNLALGGATAPVGALRAEHVAVGIGTDGAASAGLASLWLEARTALLLARQAAGPSGLDARAALEMTTIGGAACLGRAGEVGRLAVGMQADLAVWDLDGVGYAGAVTDPVETWLRCGPPRVRHTVVGMHPVVVDGTLSAPGLEQRLIEHAAIARAWQQAAA